MLFRSEVMHRAARGVIFQIFAEELHVALAGVAERHVARDVRREQEVLGLAQRMIRRQRFGHDDVERRTGEVGSERRETVRSLSVVGAGYLMGAVPSTRGPERTYLWRTSCSAKSIAGQLCTDRINAESI